MSKKALVNFATCSISDWRPYAYWSVFRISRFSSTQRAFPCLIYGSIPNVSRNHLARCDGTAWMGFYCLVMLKITLELARENPVYPDSASKFFEHFLRIAMSIDRRLPQRGEPLGWRRRRQWGGPGCQPSDRLDRAGGQTPSAIRRLARRKAIK